MTLRFVLLTLTGLLALPVVGAAAQATFMGKKETWDYAPAMRSVAARFHGTPGVVLHLGDSITYASPYTAWARGGEGKTKADVAVLRWSHCGERNDLDGWYLTSADLAGGRSYTAAGGIRADQYIAGGFKGMPSLDEIIRKYHPQVAIVMLGTNDTYSGGEHGGRTGAQYSGDMEAIIRRLLDNGTIPIVSTIPPVFFDEKKEIEFNDALWKLAAKYRLPVIDYYGEILARRPGTSWNGTLLNKDDVHPTADVNGVTATSAPTPANLRESGYLLRGWLSVRKLEEVKARVLGRQGIGHSE